MSSKESITREEILTFLSMMNNNNKLSDIITKLDPSVTPMELYYYHERVKYYKESSKVKISMGEAVAIMLKEEKELRATVAFAMYGFCNYYYGGKHADRVRARNDDKISQVLDKLAEDLGGRLDVVKINFGKNDIEVTNENEDDIRKRPPFGERDNTSDTGEGKGN